MSDFDPEKFYLGRLCKRGHNWNGTGQTLRYKFGSCKKCHLEQKSAALQKAKEKERRRLEYLEKNKDKIRARQAEYYQRNRDKKAEYRKRNRDARIEYYRMNRDKLLRQKAQYYKTDKGKASRSKARTKRRGFEDQVIGHFSPEDLRLRRQSQGELCAYCGNPNKFGLTVDHFLPLSLGGTNAISNILLACYSCNSSKRNDDPLEWFQRQEFYSDTQWKRILKLLGKKSTNYNQLTIA